MTQPAEENRFGIAVGLLMDAACFLNSESDIAKRINTFIATVHPLECGPFAATDIAGAVAALRELVECKDMHDYVEANMPALSEPRNYYVEEKSDDYNRRKPLAWQRARDVLKNAAPQGESRVERGDEPGSHDSTVRTEQHIATSREALACVDGPGSTDRAEDRASASSDGAAERARVRGSQIKRSLAHDAGAYAQCSYCRRYSDILEALTVDRWPCDCGNLHGWTGSFERPDATSKWSEARKT